MSANPVPTPFWLVWSPDGIRPPSYRHATLAAASAEADRLASASPGSKFFVLAPLSSTVSIQHTREKFCDSADEVPF